MCFERKREKAERYFLLTPVLKVDREIEREKDFFIRNKRKEKKRERARERSAYTHREKETKRFFKICFMHKLQKREGEMKRKKEVRLPPLLFFTFSPDCGINSHVCVSGKEFELCPRERTREKVAKVD